MENQKKVTNFLLLLILLVSCSNEPHKKEDQVIDNDPLSAIKLYLGSIENNGSERTFQVRSIFSTVTEVKGYFSIDDNVAQFQSLINQYGDTLEVHETIDSESFAIVGLSENEKRKIRNPYFFDGRMQCYYYDLANFYTYLDKESPQFLLLGKTNEAELLGGHYVQVVDQVFSQGIKMDSVDVSSFHTMEVWQEGTEWYRTIGLDKYHMYVNEKKLTKERFEKIIAPNDSLKKIYFPK